MSLRQLDLTTALRPSLQPDETLLFVQDAVGLYSGRVKLPQYQNGHAYLTSHRACYVDNDQPRSKAVAINLKDVDRCEAHVRNCCKDFSKTSIDSMIRAASSSHPQRLPSYLRS